MDTSILSLLLEEGDTFVDVGANQGAFSIVASYLVGGSGQVVSIEPQVRLAAAIESSLAASPVSRYKIYQVAVGDYDGEIRFVVPLSYTGMAGLYESFSGAKGYSTSRVPIRRFDDLVDWKSFAGNVLIKLDVEGAEYSFLKGASKMIDALRPDILMEVNPSAMRASNTSIEDLIRILKSFNYDRYSELWNLSVPLSIEDLSVSHRNIWIRAR